MDTVAVPSGIFTLYNDCQEIHIKAVYYSMSWARTHRARLLGHRTVIAR